MPVRTVSLYTYRTKGSGWTAAQLGVLRFVRALKKEPDLGGRQDIRVNGAVRSLGDENRRDAFEWFGEMAIRVLQDELTTTCVVLVPIPDCQSTLDIIACRTVDLAHAIVQKSDAIVQDVLRWDQPMPSARSGLGPRGPLPLYPHLRSRYPLGGVPRPYVLIDDVTTSGGHIRACAAFLGAQGADVRLAICGAKSDPDPPDDPFVWRIDEWPDFIVPSA
jgi:hypothetical protein